MCISRFGRALLEGYVYPQRFLRSDGIELLARSAEALVIPYEEVRAVYFVRDFGKDPEQNQRKVFSSRPKLGGLWVRMRFVDGEELEGVIPNDLRNIGLHGVTLTPPDSKGNTQRVFVPSRALDAFVVMGVIGSPLARRRREGKAPSEDQLDLFPSERATPPRLTASRMG